MNSFKSFDEYVKDLDSAYNTLLVVSGLTPEKAVAFYADIYSHLELLNSESLAEDFLAERTLVMTETITNFFSTLDKNKPEVLEMLFVFRQLVGHVNVSLMDKFKLTGENKMNLKNDKNEQDEVIDAAVENATAERSDLKEKLEEAKEVASEAITACGDYWSMTNIAIAATGVTLIAGAAAYIGYKYGYSAGQEECPVIINVGSME